MSRRPSPRRDRPGVPDRGQPPANAAGGDAALPATRQATPIPERLVAGLVGDADAVRSGEDVRRRGWFWHWNSIVTQFAPLIGLKGVGLLNSYTVWTDRREESPHRGYAFPSQQREADFYGEDRAELIAINKILVALDLIEIRKEMVLRVDEKGRRWRVPHNFYRVKDHSDGFTLTSRDVLRVVELADRDQAVYRIVRHIFSARFAPIDADNVWVRILDEVRQTEVWQRLAARVAQEEDRASARTRAGHAARKAALGMTKRRDTATIAEARNDSVDVGLANERSTAVANANKGLDSAVARSNKGLEVSASTAVATGNSGRLTDVAHGNTTYDQSVLTTMTTEIAREEADLTNAISAGEPIATGHPDAPSSWAAAMSTSLTGKHLAADLRKRPAPIDADGEAAAIRAFEDANGRRSTPAEHHLLRNLAERFDPAARERARPGLDSGWAWVAAAIYEAVEAGSAFVAPRRLREILSRWEREGLPAADAGPAFRTGAPAAGRARAPSERSALVPLGQAPDIPLPHGFGSVRTWAFTVGLLGAVLDHDRLTELLAGTAIAGYWDGEVTLAVPDADQAERIMGEYRELIARKLSEAMRRPVRLAVLTGGPAMAERQEDEEAAGTRPSAVAPPEEQEDDPVPPSFVVAECGLPSSQVWAAVLEEVVARGGVSRANFDAWLRTTLLIGRDERGGLVVGVPHALARRRVAGRFLAPLREAAAAIIGADLPIEIVVTREWLRSGAGRGRLPAIEAQRKGA